jgi:SpoU rRNA methylase family enzyme
VGDIKDVFICCAYISSLINFAEVLPLYWLLTVKVSTDDYKSTNAVEIISTNNISFPTGHCKLQRSNMAVIWGLDLHEIQWRKFKGSYMFNQEYHLRRIKMIVYQFAMILTVVSESIGTAALSGILYFCLTPRLLSWLPHTDYVDQQDGISTRSKGKAMVQNNDIIGVMSYNIFIGIAVATIFGSGFFFDLFWPERHESKVVKLAWKISSVVISFMTLADAIAVTVGYYSYSLERILTNFRSSSQLGVHILQVSQKRKAKFGSMQTASLLVYIDTMATAWLQQYFYG